MRGLVNLATLALLGLVAAPIQAKAQVDQASLCRRIAPDCSAVCPDGEHLAFEYFVGTWVISGYVNPIYDGTRTTFRLAGDGGTFTTIYPTETFDGQWHLRQSTGGQLILRFEPEGLRSAMMSEDEKNQIVLSCTADRLQMSIIVHDMLNDEYFESTYWMTRQ